MRENLVLDKKIKIPNVFLRDFQQISLRLCTKSNSCTKSGLVIVQTLRLHNIYILKMK